VVLAVARNVTVLGTKFVVRRNGSRVQVAVVEGRVRVDQVGPVLTARSTTITTGDTAIGDPTTILVRSDSEQQVQEELGWRKGMLLFDSTSLADAASEFNRYNRKALVITDPKTAKIKIGGSFEARNVDAFARLLKQAYGLNVTIDGDKIFVSG